MQLSLAVGMAYKHTLNYSAVPLTCLATQGKLLGPLLVCVIVIPILAFILFVFFEIS